MKKTLLLATFLAIAGASPSSAVTLASPGALTNMAAPVAQAGNIELVRYTDRYYGQRWWWGYLEKPHGRCLRVVKSRYVRGCGYYNCYSGKFGSTNRVARTGAFRGGQLYVYPFTNTYPEAGFGIVIH